ncbi:MAG: SpoIIE family protein phosphatase [Microscillaceae bacterium]|nr:SpoIIE family protein phosphatase [Microscillaceae bacterium]
MKIFKDKNQHTLRGNKLVVLIIGVCLTSIFAADRVHAQVLRKDSLRQIHSDIPPAAEKNASDFEEVEKNSLILFKRNKLLIHLVLLETLLIVVLAVSWFRKNQLEKKNKEYLQKIAEEIALKESQIEGQKRVLKNTFYQFQQGRVTIQEQDKLIEELKKTLQFKSELNRFPQFDFLSEKFLNQPPLDYTILKSENPLEALQYHIENQKQRIQNTIEKLYQSGKIAKDQKDFVSSLNNPPFPVNIQRMDGELHHQRIMLDRKSKDTLDSINYARQIQDALLPKMDVIQKTLPESFVFFKPRDIVSGDFYWFDAKNHRTIISALDCTGHGVPGAFLTMIANELLNKTVQLRGISEPDKILNQLQLEMRNTLKQKENGNEDGMDIAICTIHQVPPGLEELFGKPRIEFSGARSSMIYIQDGKLNRLRGDRIPIGGYLYQEDHIFTKQVIEISKPTTFYLFSDGFQDQFGGGEDRKKFMISRFKDLLLQIHKEPLDIQKNILGDTLSDWMGSFQQLDDILVIGVHIDPSHPFI